MSGAKWTWNYGELGSIEGQTETGYTAIATLRGLRAGEDCYALTIARNGEIVHQRNFHSAMRCMDEAERFVVSAGDIVTVTVPDAPEATDTFSLVTEQSAPVANEHPAVWPLVVEDMTARDAEGRRKYGVPLQPHNGRDVLVDAYQEALDLCVYLRQAIYERDGR